MALIRGGKKKKKKGNGKTHWCSVLNPPGYKYII